jgi:glutathione S-transferase
VQLTYAFRDVATNAQVQEKAELKQGHPLGKSPVIEDDGQVLAESGAIAEYILRRYGNGRLQPVLSSPSYDDYVHWMHMPKARQCRR